jgi:hypothetical protein
MQHIRFFRHRDTFKRSHLTIVLARAAYHLSGCIATDKGSDATGAFFQSGT